MDEFVPDHLERLLRRAVLDHASTQSRRVFPPVLHVGVPGALVADLTLGDQRLDHALRTDAVEAMVRRTENAGQKATPLLVWLTRRGELEVQDIDLAWSAATAAAAAELGRALPFVVVNRRGWRDPRSGASRSWQRLRQR